jgi:hypothetical protein
LIFSLSDTEREVLYEENSIYSSSGTSISSTNLAELRQLAAVPIKDRILKPKPEAI